MRTTRRTWSKWHAHPARPRSRPGGSAVERATHQALRDQQQRAVVIDLITRTRRA